MKIIITIDTDDPEGDDIAEVLNALDDNSITYEWEEVTD